MCNLVKHLGNPGPISNVHLRIWELGLGGEERGGNERTNPFGKSTVVVNALATVNTVGDIKSPLYLSHRRRETFALGANTNLYPPKTEKPD